MVATKDELLAALDDLIDEKKLVRRKGKEGKRGKGSGDLVRGRVAKTGGGGGKFGGRERWWGVFETFSPIAVRIWVCVSRCV